jgi:hypothetical protein
MPLKDHLVTRASFAPNLKVFSIFQTALLNSSCAHPASPYQQQRGICRVPVSMQLDSSHLAQAPGDGCGSG